MCSKAFYLRGKAYQCLKDYEMANGDLQKTLELLDEEETQSAERGGRAGVEDLEIIRVAC